MWYSQNILQFGINFQKWLVNLENTTFHSPRNKSFLITDFKQDLLGRTKLKGKKSNEYVLLRLIYLHKSKHRQIAVISKLYIFFLDEYNDKTRFELRV